VAVLACLPSIGASDLGIRVLSLDLCTDWMLARHADRSQVVGLSPYVDQYPVDWLDPAWPRHNGTLEQILELDPDLVLTGQYNALLLRQRLKALGVRVEILPLPENLAEIADYEQRFLRLLDMTPDSSSQEIMADNYPATGKRLLLLGANGIGTGRQTFEQDIIAHAGWENYLQDTGHLNLDMEQLIDNPPDAILSAAPRSEALANRFAQHPALKQLIPGDRWITSDSWRWQCPGPWSRELVRQLHQ